MQIITLAGFERLSAELRFLWRVKRPEIVRALADAAAEGDRSENAEYIYRKKELRETDRKIRFLRKHLQDIQVVRELPAKQNKIYFAAWVDLEDSQGQLHTFRLVGGLETEFHPQYISIYSPMAKALLGKELDDEVKVELPDGAWQTYTVVAIRYEKP